MKNWLYSILIVSFCMLSGELFAQCSVTIDASPDNPVCKGTTVTFTASSSTGNITSYIWEINGDTVSFDSTITSSTDYAQIILYAVVDLCGTVVNDTVVASKFILNTAFQADYSVLVIECNQPKADIQINGITNSQFPGKEPFTYDLITYEGSQGQKDLYPDVAVGNYPLVVTDANGCVDTTWIVMDVYQCPPPMPGEVITPNEDGRNDTWYIGNLDFYPDNEVYIFDRWGQRVYHKKGYDNKDGWAAKYVGTDLPVSTYYYVLRVKFEKSDEQVYKGAISVFR